MERMLLNGASAGLNDHLATICRRISIRNVQFKKQTKKMIILPQYVAAFLSGMSRVERFPTGRGEDKNLPDWMGKVENPKCIVVERFVLTSSHF